MMFCHGDGLDIVSMIMKNIVLIEMVCGNVLWIMCISMCLKSRGTYGFHEGG